MQMKLVTTSPPKGRSTVMDEDAVGTFVKNRAAIYVSLANVKNIYCFLSLLFIVFLYAFLDYSFILVESLHFSILRFSAFSGQVSPEQQVSQIDLRYLGA